MRLDPALADQLPPPAAHAGVPPAVRLQLLGGFQLRAAAPLELPLSAQRVVAFVALHDRRVLRRYVAASLWLDVSDEQAAARPPGPSVGFASAACCVPMVQRNRASPGGQVLTSGAGQPQGLWLYDGEGTEDRSPSAPILPAHALEQRLDPAVVEPGLRTWETGGSVVRHDPANRRPHPAAVAAAALEAVKE